MKVESFSTSPMSKYKSNPIEVKKVNVADNTAIDQVNNHQQVISEDIVAKKISKINEELQSLNHNFKVQYNVHQDSNRIVIEFKDSVSDEIVFQFPAEQILNYDTELDKQALVIDEKV